MSRSQGVLVAANRLCSKQRMVASSHPWWSWRGLALAFTASALWGLAPVFTKAALDAISAELIALLRLLVAALLCRIGSDRRSPWLIRDRWLWIAGVALGVDFALYTYGIQRTSAAVAGLLVNVEVLSTIALAVLLLGERLPARRLVGGAVTLAGAIYLSLDDHDLSTLPLTEQPWFGNLLVMASSVCWSVYAVGQRRSATHATPFARLTTIFLVAALTVSPTCLRPEAWRATADPVAWGMLLLLAGLCTFAVYWLYAHAQESTDVSVLAILLCTIPIFSVLFAYLLLGEALTSRLLVGGLVILAGIAVVATDPHGEPGEMDPARPSV